MNENDSPWVSWGGVIVGFPVVAAVAVLLTRGRGDAGEPIFISICVVYVGLYFAWVYRRGRALSGEESTNDPDGTGLGSSPWFYRLLAASGFAAFPLAILLIVLVRRDHHMADERRRRYVLVGIVAIAVGCVYAVAATLALMG
jgi:hypothetical protein